MAYILLRINKTRFGIKCRLDILGSVDIKNKKFGFRCRFVANPALGVYVPQIGPSSGFPGIVN